MLQERARKSVLALASLFPFLAADYEEGGPAGM